VPSKVWLGFPDPAKCKDKNKFEKALVRMSEVSLSGVKELKAAERKKIVRYVMDKTHWSFGGNADKVKKKPAKSDSGATGGKPQKVTSSETSLAIAGKARERFVMPVPGQKGAPKGSLAGQTFVVTGLFPEIGGGEGLAMGKDKVKKMIKSFGGKVASAVSGRTDVLVVGKDPGFSKVTKARKSGKTRLLSLHDVKVGVERGSLEEGAKSKPMLIRSFSKGFAQQRGGPKSLADSASKADLAIASGSKSMAKKITGDKQKATKKREKARAAKLKQKALKMGASGKKRSAPAMGATTATQRKSKLRKLQ